MGGVPGIGERAAAQALVATIARNNTYDQQARRSQSCAAVADHAFTIED